MIFFNKSQDSCLPKVIFRGVDVQMDVQSLVVTKPNFAFRDTEKMSTSF